MNLDEETKKNLTVGAFIAVIFFVGFAYCNFVIFKTGYTRNVILKKDLDKEIKSLNNQLKEIKRAEQQKDQIAKMKATVEAMAKKLPSTSDATGFYNELIGILRMTGVVATRIDPLPRRNQRLYSEIPYSIEAHCRYHELGQFMNLIEENKRRFMRISTFNISNNNKRPSIHPVKLTISTFMFNGK